MTRFETATARPTEASPPCVREINKYMQVCTMRRSISSNNGDDALRLDRRRENGRLLHHVVPEDVRHPRGPGAVHVHPVRSAAVRVDVHLTHSRLPETAVIRHRVRMPLVLYHDIGFLGRVPWTLHARETGGRGLIEDRRDDSLRRATSRRVAIMIMIKATPRKQC